MGNTPLCFAQRRVSASALGPGLEDESHQVTEENGGGDAAGEGPQKAVFGHGLGHGVGFEIHEWPRFGRGDSTLAAEGMVVTDEPGIYLPGKFGVRIEDVLYLSGEGCVDITKAPKDLLIL